MDQETFDEQFEALLDKYSELLVGSSEEEVVEKVKMWALYSHIAKTMPALIQHWNGLYPEAKNQIREISGEVKRMNEEYRNSKLRP